LTNSRSDSPRYEIQKKLKYQQRMKEKEKDLDTLELAQGLDAKERSQVKLIMTRKRLIDNFRTDGKTWTH